jgi:hypothetical protein
MKLKTWLCTILLLAAAAVVAATPSANELIGHWQVAGLSEGIDEPPGEAPPEVFTFRNDGTVHSALSDSADQWRLEDGGIIVESVGGSQRLEIVEYDGDRMKWALAVGDLLIVYHLVRVPDP